MLPSDAVGRASSPVTGYHGTHGDAARAILRDGFIVSENDYDWLGRGVDFFQDAPQRSIEWAARRYGNTAAVVGAVIHLQDCMDLLDITWASLLAEAYDSFLGHLKKAGLVEPRQTTGAHRLDKAVIDYICGMLHDGGTSIRSVRAAFAEGAPVFPSSALMSRAHVQIAVRDVSVIERSWLHVVPDQRSDG